MDMTSPVQVNRGESRGLRPVPAASVWDLDGHSVPSPVRCRVRTLSEGHRTHGSKRAGARPLRRSRSSVEQWRETARTYLLGAGFGLSLVVCTLFGVNQSVDVEPAPHPETVTAVAAQ